MAHFPIFPQASQAPRIWKNQMMSMFLHLQPGTHIHMPFVINEESMLDWEGHKKNARDHEKRVVSEEIPSDETMISSLALCEKEEKIT